MNEHLHEPQMEHVEKALSALREASLGHAAPERVEAALLHAFRAQHQAPAPTNSRRRYAWLAGAIAASLAVMAAVRLSKPAIVTAPEPRVVATTPAPAPAIAEIRNEPKPAPPRVKRTPRARRETPAVTARAQERGELATDFFAIPYAPAMTQVDSGQLVRVNVPATSMRTFGLPVSEDRLFDRVQADVLMGEDGIARAIRFVRQQNSGLNYR